MEARKTPDTFRFVNSVATSLRVGRCVSMFWLEFTFYLSFNLIDYINNLLVFCGLFRGLPHARSEKPLYALVKQLSWLRGALP